VAEEDIPGLMAYIRGQRTAVVALTSPRWPNQGLMADEDFRSNLNPQPTPGRWMDFRVAEYLLFQRNIRIPMTRAEEDDCPNWMRTGFQLYRLLERQGYKAFPAENEVQQTLEVYPQAAYTVLLERLPFSKNSLEGRLQRQLVLHSRAVDLPDPMRIFEEITRYRILQGILPLERLYDAERLDALVAAYTAWYAVTKPLEEVTLVGDGEEGQIVLPGGNLKGKYS